MPPPPLNLTRLNPTTITVPTGTPNGKILKVAISPHLLIQSPILESPPVKARKDADALFEVIVPVGGRVEVDLGVEGVEDLENTTGRTWYEYEVEDAVRRLVKRLIELNRDAIHVETVDVVNNDRLALYPRTATASRAMGIRDVIQGSGPVAHLERLQLTLTWTGPSPAAQAQISESRPIAMASQGNPRVVAFAPHDDSRGRTRGTTAGPLPAWASEQVCVAMIKILRGELVKRFPLVFDRDFEQYLARITPPQALADSFTRCLQLSQMHSTPLLARARRRLRVLAEAQKTAAIHEQEQVRALASSGRRGNPSQASRRVDGEYHDPADGPSNTSDDPIDAAIATPEGPSLTGVLTGCLARIGRDRWDRLRSRPQGRLSYNRIQVRTFYFDEALKKKMRDGSDDSGTPGADEGVALNPSVHRLARLGPVGFADYRGHFNQVTAFFDSDHSAESQQMIDNFEEDDLFESDDFLDDEFDDELLSDDGDNPTGLIPPVVDGLPKPYRPDEESHMHDEWLEGPGDIDDMAISSCAGFTPSDQPAWSAQHCTMRWPLQLSQISVTSPHAASNGYTEDDLESMLSFTTPDDTQTTQSMPRSLPTSSWSGQWAHDPSHPHQMGSLLDLDAMLIDSDSGEDLLLDDEKGAAMSLPRSGFHGTAVLRGLYGGGIRSFQNAGPLDPAEADGMNPLETELVHEPFLSDSDEGL